MKIKKFSNSQCSLQGYVSGSLSLISHQLAGSCWVFFFKLFSAHFLLRIFLSTAAVLTFHEYGETIRGGGIFPHSLEQCLSMSRHMCCYSSETVVTSGFGSVCGEAGS